MIFSVSLACFSTTFRLSREEILSTKYETLYLFSIYFLRLAAKFLSSREKFLWSVRIFPEPQRVNAPSSEGSATQETVITVED